jgi:hypothetical protein
VPRKISIFFGIRASSRAGSPKLSLPAFDACRHEMFISRPRQERLTFTKATVIAVGPDVPKIDFSQPDQWNRRRSRIFN